MLKVSFIQERTALNYMSVRMQVRESVGHGINVEVGQFDCSREDMAVAVGLAREEVCNRERMPPSLRTNEIRIYWEKVAAKVAAIIGQLCPIRS